VANPDDRSIAATSGPAPEEAAMTQPHTTVPFDLYRDIHKAIRAGLFEVTAEAGRLDASDRTARVAHANRVRELVRFLELHAEHEDEHLQTAIEQVLPDRAAAIAADHVALEVRMQSLVALADLAFECERDDDRAAVHDLYLELSSFTASYLQHQDVEERVVMPALWDAFGFEGVLAIHERIVTSIPPDDMAWSLSRMLPAMNVDDRTEMLAGIRQSAPPEAFAGVLGLAAQVLAPTDHDVLARRLEPAPVG
jgi:hypothetical protein